MGNMERCVVMFIAALLIGVYLLSPIPILIADNFGDTAGTYAKILPLSAIAALVFGAVLEFRAGS